MSITIFLAFFAGTLVGAAMVYYATGWWSKRHPINGTLLQRIGK